MHTAYIPSATSSGNSRAPFSHDIPQKFGTKSEGVEAHFRWISSISPADVCAYSDGSSEGHGRSSWGYVLQREGLTFEKNQGPLHGGEVFDAEIMGATMALRAAINARRAGGNIFVLLDSQAAVGALQTGNFTSCMWKTRVFHDVASKVKTEMRWMPGHSKISGNKEADVAAHAALQALSPHQTLPE